MARTLRQVFAVPVLLALASAAGLVSALLGDGLWDGLSWLGLGVVVAAALWHGLPWHNGRQGGQP